MYDSEPTGNSIDVIHQLHQKYFIQPMAQTISFFCYCCIRILYLYTLFKHSVGNKLYQYITWNGPLCIIWFFLFYLAFIAYACSIDSKCYGFDTEGNFYGKGVTVAGKGDSDLYLFLNK